MRTYREKTRTIEAVQFDPLQQPWPDELIQWASWRRDDGSYGYVDTADGRAHVKAQDWIIRGPSRTLHVCNPFIFASLYEPAEEPS